MAPTTHLAQWEPHTDTFWVWGPCCWGQGQRQGQPQLCRCGLLCLPQAMPAPSHPPLTAHQFPSAPRNLESGCLDAPGRKVWRIHSKLLPVVRSGSGSVVLGREEIQVRSRGLHLHAYTMLGKMPESSLFLTARGSHHVTSLFVICLSVLREGQHRAD